MLDYIRKNGLGIGAFLFFASSLILVVSSVYDARQEERAKEDKRNEFYHKHRCQHFGYISTKSQPIRTYQCDNGLFIWEDML